MSPKKSTANWPLPYAEPEEVEMSSECLSHIRPVLQRFIDEGMDPNFITMVIRHGKIVHYEAQGYMDIESKKTCPERYHLPPLVEHQTHHRSRDDDMRGRRPP